MSKTPLTVLLIEDSPEDGELLRRMVNSSNYNINLTEVRSLAEAQEHVTCDTETRCACNKWDAILLDLHLPNGTGLASIRKVRGWCSKSALVVHTGLQDEELDAYFDAGADDFVEKSASPKQKLATILRASRQTQARRKKSKKWATLRVLAEGLEKQADALLAASITSDVA